MKGIHSIRLLRPWQWYKNLVIFIALIFTHNFFHYTFLYNIFLGFLSLCFISSTNYIINDIKDREKDKLHEEKKKRPVASGKVTLTEAFILAGLFFLLSTVLAAMVSTKFLLVVLFLFIITLAYTFWLKKIIFLDLIIIAINFVVRSISGAYIINVEISPWLLLGAFFFAVFLATSKRRGDLLLTKNTNYTKETLDQMIAVLVPILIVAYSFYTFLKAEEGFMITVPIVVYGIFQYIDTTNKNPEIARKPELCFKEKSLLITFLLWIVAIFSLIYIL